MKYNSLIYLTEQLKIIKGTSETNSCNIENYIKYLASVLGGFGIQPGSINKQMESEYYDLSFKANLKGAEYKNYYVMCKTFTPYYIINANLNVGYSEIRINRNINGLRFFIFYNGLQDNKNYGLYYLEKNTVDSNQEFHISFYDYKTYSLLTHDCGIKLSELKSYTPTNLYELGILPDYESTVSIISLGLLNNNELQYNNIGDVNNLITYRILNEMSFNTLVNRIINSFNTSKHI